MHQYIDPILVNVGNNMSEANRVFFKLNLVHLKGYPVQIYQNPQNVHNSYNSPMHVMQQAPRASMNVPPPYHHHNYHHAGEAYQPGVPNGVYYSGGHMMPPGQHHMHPQIVSTVQLHPQMPPQQPPPPTTHPISYMYIQQPHSEVGNSNERTTATK